MSDAGPVEPGEEPRRVDRQLLAESNLYGIAYQAYVALSPRERGAVKGRWVNKIRLEAKRRGIDPDLFVSTDEDGREKLRSENPEQQRRPAQRQAPPAPPTESGESRSTAKSFEDVMRRHPTKEEEPPSPRRAPPPIAPVYDEGLLEGDPDEPHSSMDEVPPNEHDPRLRSQATLGDVRPTDNEDLAGWKQPRNLLDVYARYSVGDGQHFIRVERIDPKVWAGIPCSGYLGEIRAPITEPEFHAWYGGRVYSLTVYGPDPKGRHDPSTGLPVIKAKTEPFRYTVPMLPPNLAMRPGTNPTKQQGERPMMQSPFGFPPPGALPATPADASMHKSNLDFLQNQLNKGEEERKELRRQLEKSGSPSADVLGLLTGAQKDALERTTKASEKREEALQEQLRESREEMRDLKIRLDKEADERRQRPQTTAAQDAAEIIRVSQPAKTSEDVLRSHQEELSRARTSFKEDMDRVIRSHQEECGRIRDAAKEAAAALKDRQDDEVKRIKDRLEENERRSRERETDLERRMRDQETELRRQMDQIRNDERAAAVARVAETVARFEERVKDVKEQHERELRMTAEQHTTRIDNTKSTLQMQLSMAKERVEKLEEEVSEAREEAEKSKDPIAVMEKGSKLAEALGFKKDDNGPTTAGERFVATVGMGLSKAFETMNDWLPRAMEARAQGAKPPPGAPRALPPGMQPQQQQRPRQQTKRAVSWATQGSVPIAGQQPYIPPETPFVQVQAQPPVQAPAQPQPSPQPPPMAPPQQGPTDVVQPSAPPPPAQAATNGHAPASALGGAIPEAAIVEFKAEVERAINAGLPAEVFAQQFVEAYPEPSWVLVSYKPENFLDVVKGMAGGAESVILRRDGKKWVDKLWQQIIAQHQARATAAQQSQVAPS